MFKLPDRFHKILIHLIMSAYIKENNLIFQFDINDTDIGRDGKSPSTLQVTGQRMVIDGRSAKSLDEHINANLILRAKLGIFSNALRITLYEGTVKLNPLHAGGIPSCF